MRAFARGVASSMKKTAVGLFAVGALAASSASAAPVELVTNGGFETDLAGWNMGGDTTYTFVDTREGGAHTGLYNACIGPATMGYLSQSIATDAGAQYHLSYWLATMGTGPGDVFQVRIDDTLQPGLTVSNLPDLPWTEYRTTFTATSGSTDIEFGAMNSVDYWYLDDVSVTAVPEPMCLGLIGATAGLLSVRRRREV